MTPHLKIVVTDHDGKRHEIPALSGWRIMEIIRDSGLPIFAECGGSCACSTCHVYIDEKWIGRIPLPHEDELELLDTVKGLVDNRSRLSCQVLMRDDLDGLEVTLAPGSEPAG
jgi:ferredoxin, 2Fe-2S